MKNVNKSIASSHGQKNNGYSAFTEYPLSHLPTPSDRCHNRNFLNYFLMSPRVTSAGVFCDAASCMSAVRLIRSCVAIGFMMLETQNG